MLNHPRESRRFPPLHENAAVPWRFLTWTVVFLLLTSEALRADSPPTSISEVLRDKALACLNQGLRDETEWTKVHAAEFLLWLDRPAEPIAVFERELQERGAEPKYRIGIWRVLAQGSHRATTRRPWLARVRAAFLDPEGPDRTHAVETLGKLNYAPDRAAPEDQLFSETARHFDGPISVFSAWVVANDLEPKSESLLAGYLRHSEVEVRRLAGYSVRWLDGISEETRHALVEAIEREPKESPALAYLLSAGFVHGVVTPNRNIRDGLADILREGTDVERAEACAAFARAGGPDDLQFLVPRLDDPHVEVRLAASYAVLQLARRTPRHLDALDISVLGAYGLGMLAIGFYFSRKNQSSDDYLLGGRRMNPIGVGLSLFATLLSTISYLAVPGEMIQNGPLICISQILAFPIIALVVGWALIPFFMRLPVTSAYEILDSSLGPSARTLGSVYFLFLRLMWMSLIIRTTSIAIVPVLGLDPPQATALSIGLGVVTILYTSLGGLRAVVVTDVVQTGILFGGALLTMAFVTSELGGVREWFPTQWAHHWEEPHLLFHADARVTVLGVAMSTFLWYVCTAGSDQMAIQRYLATRNVRTARQAFVTSLAAEAGATVFLGLVGFAILAYFRAHPDLLPAGNPIGKGADQLFPRYIVVGLPSGISGLVVAGILAAAMSSLSSGLSASSSVVTVDFLDRFRGRSSTEAEHIRTARITSFAIGAAVILLSLWIGLIPGTILELAYKVTNLLVVPLFLLFFMALFVPWATEAGSIVGSLAGLGVAIAIAYFSVFNLSFIWMMPASFLIGASVGALASVVPLGNKNAV